MWGKPGRNSRFILETDGVFPPLRHGGNCMSIVFCQPVAVIVNSSCQCGLVLRDISVLVAERRKENLGTLKHVGTVENQG